MQLSTESATRLMRLLDLCLEINSEKNLDTLIDLLVDKIPGLLGAARGTLLLHDPKNSELWSRVAGGLGVGEEIRIPDKTGIAGYCFQNRCVLNVPDAYEDPRFNPEVDADTGFRTTSILTLPISNAEEMTTGVVQLMNKEGGFSDEDEQFCLVLAAQVAIAIESAKTFQKLRREQEGLADENRRLRGELKTRHDFSNLIGNSPPFTKILECARQVAPTAATVLLTGETGTGKEIIAKLIHYHSPRADSPFLAINCSAVPDQLLESELFGYERGAFTGAVGTKQGLFEAADQGTMFLDEIAEMPFELQAKLLRVLQEGEVRRLGSTEGKHVDVRVIAATNKQVRSLVEQGEFREDLYYRLNVVPMELPPLRDRRGDVPLLAEHFLQFYSQRHGREAPRLTDDALDCFMGYSFPGNIRELENAIERAVVLARGPVVNRSDLPAEIQNASQPIVDIQLPRTNDELKEAKRLAREEAQRVVEERFLTELLRSANGVVTRAAEQAGINRSLLQQMLSRHRISADEFRVKDRNGTKQDQDKKNDEEGSP